MTGATAASLFETIVPVVGKAVRAFVVTVVGMLLLGTTLAVACGVIVADDGIAFIVAAALVCVVDFALLGAMLGMKRAVGSSLAAAFSNLQLGSRIARVVFARVLEVEAVDPHGDRGVAVARTAERVPLAAAEQRLRAAIDTVLRVREGTPVGFFRRRLQKAAVDKVEQYTLAQFREQQAVAGGIDLIKVRDDVATRIDGAVSDALEGALKKTTALFVVGACVGALGGAWGLHVVAQRLS